MEYFDFLDCKGYLAFIFSSVNKRKLSLSNWFQELIPVDNLPYNISTWFAHLNFHEFAIIYQLFLTFTLKFDFQIKIHKNKHHKNFYQNSKIKKAYDKIKFPLFFFF